MEETLEWLDLSSPACVGAVCVPGCHGLGLVLVQEAWDELDGRSSPNA